MFFEANGVLHPIDSVLNVDMSEINMLRVKICFKTYGDRLTLEGVDAINFIYRHCPHALEGKRLRWIKYGWAIHNFIGHPLMQLLCLFGFYKLGIKVHDATIPKPRGAK